MSWKACAHASRMLATNDRAEARRWANVIGELQAHGLGDYTLGALASARLITFGSKSVLVFCRRYSVQRAVLTDDRQMALSALNPDIVVHVVDDEVYDEMLARQTAANEEVGYQALRARFQN
jgi:hypothetical protein